MEGRTSGGTGAGSAPLLSKNWRNTTNEFAWSMNINGCRDSGNGGYLIAILVEAVVLLEEANELGGRPVICELCGRDGLVLCELASKRQEDTFNLLFFS